MIEIQILDIHPHKEWWRALFLLYARPGQRFEIHCWRQEEEAAAAARRLGCEKDGAWAGGTVVEGTMDEEKLAFLLSLDTGEESAPFFNLFLSGAFYSEHYGSEIHILRQPEDRAGLDALLQGARGFASIGEI